MYGYKGERIEALPHNLAERVDTYAVRFTMLDCDIAKDIMEQLMQCTTLPSHSGFSQKKLSSPTHYPCDSARTFRVILFSIHNDEWKSFQCHHQTALRTTIKMEMVMPHSSWSRILTNMLLDCRMVVKEIKDGILEEMEMFGWWFEQDIDGENEDGNEKKLVMVNEEGWMS
ncbi:hypothetical protein Tco_0853695 [Tanacetum coccineum]